MKDQDLYLKGMKDMAEAIKYYTKLDLCEKEKALGVAWDVSVIFDKMSAQYFVNRIKNYKKEKERPKLGDVVDIEYFYASRDKAIFVEYDCGGDLVILVNGNSTPLQSIRKDLIKSITKTGEHIDIQGMLNKLA